MAWTPQDEDFYQQLSRMDFSTPAKPTAQNTSALGDLGTALGVGVRNIPGDLSGAADMVNPLTRVSPDFSVTRAATALGKATGITPGKWAEEKSAEYSPQHQQYRKEVADTKGFLPTLGVHARNPLQSAVHLTESLPAMVLPGGVVRGAAMKFGLGATGRMVGAGIGEGVMMGGAQTNQLIEQGVDPGLASNVGLATGVAGAALGVGGGALARRFGLTDLDTAFAGGGWRTAAREGAGATTTRLGRAAALAGRVAGGAFAEGAFEEMPQSASEQALSNYAQGRPLGEGMPEASASGLALGGLMGGVMNIPGARKPIDATRPAGEQAPAPAPAPATDLFGGGQSADPDAAAEPRAPEDILAEYRYFADLARGGQNHPQVVEQATAELKRLSEELKAAGVSQHATSPENAAKRLAKIETEHAKLNTQFEEALLTSPEKASGLYTKMQALRAEQAMLQQLYPVQDDAQGDLFGDTPAAQAPKTFGAAFAEAGGRNTKLRDQLDNAQSVDEVLEITRAALERTNIASSTVKAMEALHLQVAGTSYADWKTAQETNQGAPQNGSEETQPVREGQAGVEGNDVGQTDAEGNDVVQGQTQPVRGEESPAVREEGLTPAPRTSAAQAAPAPKLPVVQQAVFEYMLNAARDNRVDDIVDGSGTIQYAKIAGALGKARGSIKAAADAMMKNIAKAQGLSVEEFKASLRARTAEVRETESAAADRLGMSPTAQGSEVEDGDVFGEAQSMEIVASPGQTNANAHSDAMDAGNREGTEFLREAGALEGRSEVAVASTPDPVAERRAAEARARRDAEVAQLLAHPIAAEAAAEWDDFKADSTPAAAELDRDTAVEWVLEYARMKEGEISADELTEIQRAIERGLSENAGSGAGLDARAALPDPRSEGARAAVEAAPEDGRVAEQEATDSVTADQAGLDVSTNPIEARVARLRPQLGEKQTARLDKLVGRYASGDIDLTRFDTELEELEAKAAQGFQYSEAPATRGTTIDAVWAAVDEIVGPQGRRRITVVQSADELVARKILPSRNAGVVQGYVKGGHAYFIADNIRPGNERAVFLHEIGAHLGLEKTLSGSEFRRLVSQVKSWADKQDGSLEARLANAAIGRVAKAGTPARQRDQELVAYFVEEAVRAGVDPTALKMNSPVARWLRSLWTALRAALQKLGLVSPKALTAQDVVDLAAGAARVTAGATSGEGQFSYAGESARTADMTALQQAKRRLEEGASAAEVRAATGWFKAKDGKWRFEIDDSKARLLVEKFDLFKKYTLPQVLHHPDLYRAYPALREITVGSIGFNFGVEGWYADGHIALKDASKYKPAEEVLGTLVHEVQHAIQDIEGFARGGNTREWHNIDVSDWQNFARKVWDETFLNHSDALLDKLNELGYGLSGKGGVETLFDALPQGLDKAAHSLRLLFRNNDNHIAEAGDTVLLETLGAAAEKITPTTRVRVVEARLQELTNFIQNDPGSQKLLTAYAAQRNLRALNDEAYDSYKRLLGEVEARDVTARMRKTMEERRNEDPYVSQGVAEADLIVKQQGEGNAGRGAGQFSIADTVTAGAIAAAPEAVRPSLKAAQVHITEAVRKGRELLMFTEDLVRQATASLPSAEVWYEQLSRREQTRVAHKAKVDEIGTAFDQLDRDQFTRTWRAIHDMTTSQKWGYQPTWRDKVEIDPVLETQYEALTATERELVDTVFRHGDETQGEIQKILDDIVNGEYETALKAARTDAARAKIEKQFGQFRKLYGRKLAKLDGPYAPKRRVGSHTVVAKSQAYLDAEARGEHFELRSQPEHYRVEFYDSQAQAVARADELQGRYARVIPSVKEVTNDQEMLPFEAFDQIRKMIAADGREGAKEASTTVKKLSNLVTELYLVSLAETSARKSEMRRHNPAGMEVEEVGPDAMYRAFLAKGSADAHYIGTLQNGRTVAETYAQMRREANEPKGDRNLKRRLFNELTTRYENSVRFEDSSTVGKLLNFSSIWMLLTKPAYFVYNATQPLMLTQPALAQSHGYTKSFAAMMKAYKEVVELPSFTSKGAIDLHSLPADVREDVIRLRDMGRIDITLTQDLGDRIHGARGTVGRGWQWAERTLKGFTQKVEMTNRVVSAIAALRLAREAGTANPVRYASKIIYDTHGDYSNLNAPRAFNHNSALRVMTQFRKFQFIQIGQLVRMFNEAKSGATLEEKWALSRALRFTLAHHAVMAGAMGLPAMSVIAWAFSALGDDDEPRDLELTLTKMIGDETAAKLLMHGVPALANLNMTSNVGMGQTFSILPFADVSFGERGGYEKAVTALTGPLIGGFGLQAWDALGAMGKGDYYKGLEGLLPSGVRAAAKAFREASEGVTNRKGDVLVAADEIDAWATGLKLMGFRTEDDAMRQMVRGAQFEFERAFSERTSTLKKHYTEAYRAGDAAAMREARENWVQMQQHRRLLGFRPQPVSNLLRAPREQKKRERQTAGGVQYDAGSKKFVLDAR